MRRFARKPLPNQWADLFVNLQRGAIGLARIPAFASRGGPSYLAGPACVEASMLTLFFAPGSSSMAVHIALHEIGAPFEAKSLSFTRNETRSPELLAVNPEGKV